ncbi:uncharacterized protein LOC132042695 [Lycium ferocissimum]|uniref:uncharacterized protein LOC132042695 n=1 Tax=Lycium ferocissimum TaxID=112874 RepID=UPI0028162C8D|nr:uncharacterized protein LOC132042695 [Lycium ferocissimum]
MNRCGMEDAGFIGSTYTWCNNRRPSKRIWKRLDKVSFNDSWLHKFQNSVVRHLSRTGSDHRPLLFKCYDDMNEGIKYFRFLNFWSDQPGFYDIVKKEWEIHIKGNPMWILQQKLKNLGRQLSIWSKEVIGDVFQKMVEWEETVQRLEDMDTLDNTEETRAELNKGQAEYVTWMAMQESLLKQQAQIKWYEEGDANTRYFHNIIKDRRRRLHLHRIQNHRGKWIQNEGKIGKTVVKHFKNLFNLPEPTVDETVVSCITKCISEEDNFFTV